MMCPEQECRQCILGKTDDPDIRFDGEGICNHCRAWERLAGVRVRTGTEEGPQLADIIEDIRSTGKGKPYDCILGISGGVDSTYLAYQAKRLNLKPLAVHFDNGWNSELSVKNIENVLNKLGFDLFTYVVNWEEFRDIQLAYLKASVIDIEIPTDHAFYAALFNVARKHRIRHILWGCNVATEGVLPSSWRWAKFDLLNLKAIYRKYGKGKFKTFPTLGFWKYTYYLHVLKIQPVPLLNYLNYNKEEAKKIITNELGWRDYGGKHYESIFTRFYQGYILPRKFGVDKRKAHLSSLICSGQITKEEAQRELQMRIYDEDQLVIDKEYVIKKFELTPDEFEHIMKLPIRSHAEFPSYVTRHYRYHEKFFAMIRPLTRIYRKVRRQPERMTY